MKWNRIIPVGILLLLSVASMSAQSALPSAHDDACWSSLESLRACQLQAEARANDYAQRCTSYPEYQCMPAEQPKQQKTSPSKLTKDNAGKVTTVPATTMARPATSGAGALGNN